MNQVLFGTFRALPQNIDLAVRMRAKRYFWAGKRLEQLRKSKNLTQDECAKLCGYNVRGWRRIEAGESRPTREKLICRILLAGLQIRGADTINAILDFFDYPQLEISEITKYKVA